MTKFTFADFQIFAGVTNVNEDAYVTVAKGVISYINKRYGIYPELETITERIFLITNQVSITPFVFPICGVNRITYDDDIIDDSTYSFYGEDILLDTAVIDVRKPIFIELAMGFEAGIPDDLILAIYKHIQAVYYAIDKHTDNVTKSVNATGNTTFYIDRFVPMASRHAYEFYAGNQMASF